MDEECFAWLSDWKTAPIKTVPGLQELYQQLLPSKLYASRKDQDTRTVMRKAQESDAHVVSGCSTLVQTLYLARQNAGREFQNFRP